MQKNFFNLCRYSSKCKEEITLPFVWAAHGDLLPKHAWKRRKTSLTVEKPDKLYLSQ
jgi:hypothetical protein